MGVEYIGYERLGEALELIRRKSPLEGYIEKVRPIVEEVSARCYEAVYEFSLRFDSRAFHDPSIYPEEASIYEEMLDYRVIEAIEWAVARVREYSRSIMPRPLDIGGVSLHWTPIERIAAYIPGGRNPYPSTAIMTIVPASVAGVREINVLTPPYKGEGPKADPGIVVAAFRSGASKVYAVGGPQAIAGTAFSCAPLPRVDKIVGPGGPYIQAAKLLVSHLVGIDMVAGPTELFIVADSSADPEVVKREALAQGEHGRDSIIVIASTDESLLSCVGERLAEEARGLEMADFILVKTRGIEEAIDLANLVAPEHLLLLVEDPEGLAARVYNAGVVSLGVPTAYLDYVAGPSHVLPTGGAARWRGGITVYDFLKPVQIVYSMQVEGLEYARRLASYEGFRFHEKSLRGW